MSTVHPLSRPSAPAPPRPVLGWIEALFIAALVVVSVAFVAGGLYLRLNGVPPTDHYGTVTGVVRLSGAGSQQWNRFAADGERATVVAVPADGGQAVAATIAADGSFQLRLKPGVYVVRASSPGASLSGTPQRVLVLGGEMLATQLRMTAPATSASAGT